MVFLKGTCYIVAMGGSEVEFHKVAKRINQREDLGAPSSLWSNSEASFAPCPRYLRRLCSSNRGMISTRLQGRWR